MPDSTKFPATGRSRAACSHSCSLGKRAPAQRAYASASKKLKCTTGSCGARGRRPSMPNSCQTPSRCRQYSGASQAWLAAVFQPSASHRSGRR